MKKGVCACVLLLCRSFLFADIGIIPYRVENPSDFFPTSIGEEYAKLIYVAAVLKKKISVVYPRDVALDLRRNGISPEKAIFPGDLELLGKSGLYDYILVGNIAKAGEKYISESALYSVRSRRTVLKVSVNSSSLISLAEKEVGEVFVSFKNREEKSPAQAALDLVFVIDSSYNVSKDFEGVKNSVLQTATKLIDSMRIDTKIYIIPFSDRTGPASSSAPLNTVISVRDELAGIKPVGGTSAENFSASLRHMVNNVRWRGAAGKMALVISNSEMKGAKLAETYALSARKKGITIYSISLGGLKRDESELIKNISQITNGRHFNAAYHQRLFDHEGKPVDLFYEGGRFFEAKYPDNDWKGGLFLEKNRSEIRRPKQFLDEIIYTEKKAPVDPHGMSKAYSSLSMRNIINENQAESNLDSLFGKIIEAPRAGFSRPLAKVLITDGKISFWLAADDRDSVKFFKEKNADNFYFPLGVSLRADETAAYGFSLIPRSRSIPTDCIPELLKLTFGDMVKKSNYYMSNGLLFPPVWFVNVKAEQIELLDTAADIRGE